MEREYVGRGGEHKVFRMKKLRNYVIKTPTIFNLWFLKTFGLSAEIIKKEYAEGEALTENTGIRVPFSIVRLRENGRRYSITQQYIKEDHSIDDVRAYIQSRNLPHVLDRYDLSPQNFITNDGIVYWVDPSKGAHIWGLLDRKGILSRQKSAAIQAKVKRGISFLIE